MKKYISFISFTALIILSLHVNESIKSKHMDYDSPKLEIWSNSPNAGGVLT